MYWRVFAHSDAGCIGPVSEVWEFTMRPPLPWEHKRKPDTCDDTMIEIEIKDQSNPFQGMEMPGMPPGQSGMAIDLGSILNRNRLAQIHVIDTRI